jgi:hypothetical protein
MSRILSLADSITVSTDSVNDLVVTTGADVACAIA